MSQASEPGSKRVLKEAEKLRKTSPLPNNQEARGDREEVNTGEDGVGSPARFGVTGFLIAHEKFQAVMKKMQTPCPKNKGKMEQLCLRVPKASPGKSIRIQPFTYN